MKNHQRFRTFLAEFTRLVDLHGKEESVLLEQGSRLLAQLVGHDDWLPDESARADAKHYQQYLLHCDALERFSVVSFVWSAGQRTPVHDHCVWGMVGVLRGAETCRRFVRAAPGEPLNVSDSYRLEVGMVDVLSPRAGDIHEVSNALADRPSISIHVYGANIGATHRHVYEPETGIERPFVSGYANALIPNFWDRSEAVRSTLGK
ncbi:MAG: cysteine dioxygenase [Proteobacteria bacterium]|nr:cysteine dioxygenase [Burkholderiales bacterium]